MKEVKIEPAGRAVKRVVVWYNQNNARLVGLRLFDKDNTMLLEALGYNFNDQCQKEWVLQDGERIIGFKSRKYSAYCTAAHLDF